MATRKRTVTDTPVNAGEAEISVEKDAREETPVQEEKREESSYTAAELANAHRTFDTSYEIVKTALKIAGKERATIAEAKEIIEKFRNKEVK